MDTIFALSTAQGKAGVAVIRLSGPSSLDTVRILCGDVPEFHKVSVRVLRDPDGRRLDEAVVLTFPKGRSFTGEEAAELQTHGSVAVVSAVLRTLSKFDDLRLSDPGEFTRRALENGRLDLTQVEGLADLIDAETESQRRQALRVLSGELGERADEWRQSLIRAAALIEATIDFVDEDVPVDVSPEVTELLTSTIESLRTEINGVHSAEQVRSGFEVAIVGAPNVGKSTLLNFLAGREAAITSEYAGTTRDVIEVRMELGGLPVTLLDTAGLRVTNDAVESIGIDRARKRAKQADLRVFLVEEGDIPELQIESGDILVNAKADLLKDSSNAVSGLTGMGISRLVDNLAQTLKARVSGIGVATRVRHQVAMERCLLSLDAALSLLPRGEDAADIVAEELRTAIRALDSLVGRVDIENVLDEIFASFCLGK